MVGDQDRSGENAGRLGKCEEMVGVGCRSALAAPFTIPVNRSLLTSNPP